MDDEALVRAVAGELLRALGHEADFATDGAAAIERYAAAKAAGTPFDVVILDLTIRGGMGGAEAVRRLLEIDPAVKVVVSSGYSDDEVVANFRAARLSRVPEQAVQPRGAAQGAGRRAGVAGGRAATPPG